jgi:hypothetical protein
MAPLQFQKLDADRARTQGDSSTGCASGKAPPKQSIGAESVGKG